MEERKKYTDHATSLNRNKGNSGRRFTVRTQDTIDAFQVAIQNNPRGATCRINGLELTKSTFNRIVVKDLKWHSYKIHKRQQLKDGDFERRMGFCEWLLIQNRNPRFLHDLIIGDEAGFPMNGKVNTPRGQAPEFTYKVSESREKRTVWIGLCGDGSLIGPFFFERNVTGLAYLEILNEKVFPAVLGTFPLHSVNGSFQRLWWAQDGARSRYHGSTRMAHGILFAAHHCIKSSC